MLSPGWSIAFSDAKSAKRGSDCLMVDRWCWLVWDALPVRIAEVGVSVESG